MSKTTFGIGASFQAIFPELKTVQLSNFEVAQTTAAKETEILGVAVRYETADTELRWCYI
jgi:hypothetical protein